MASFEELMQSVSDEMVERFDSTIQKYECVLSRELYVMIFITTFINNCYDKCTFESLHNAIDNTSLCLPETKFFHNVIDCNAPNKSFIKTLLDIYSQTKGLSKCQLGGPIKRCLDNSTELTFII